MKTKIIQGFACFAIVLLMGCSTPGPHKSYEYKTVRNVSDAALNQLVKEGWEVVSFTEYATSSDIRITYLLRRITKAE